MQNSVSPSQRGSKVMYAIAAILVVASLSFSAIMKADGSFYYILMPLMALFFFGKLVIGMMFCQGWRVFNRRMVMGLPIGLFVFYVIIASLLICMTVVNIQMDYYPDAQKNIYIFLFNAYAGVSGSLVAWFMGIKEWMASGSEYDARMEFKSKGYTQEVIEQNISALKKIGLIPSE